VGPFAEVVEQLCGFASRGSCTDAERRAALWLHDDLRSRGHEAWVETLWVRPQWWWSLCWHAVGGLTASLVSVASPTAGVAVAVPVFLSYLLEVAGAGGLLRLALFRRATQVVVVEPRAPDAIALLLTANTDAPRRGLVFRERWRRLGGRLRPGPLWWVVVALALVAVAAVARLLGAEGSAVGLPQFVPTAGLLLTAAAALDVALSQVSPGASDDASGIALALALHQALVDRPPGRLSAGLVLAGAGELFPYGLRAHLRADKPAPRDTVLLECGPVGEGTPAWTTDHPQLIEACIAAAEHAVRHRVTRPTAAGAGRLRRIPGLEVRCIDAHGVPPRVRTEHDVPGAVDPAAIEGAYAFTLAVVAALDAEVSPA
jgi:hypothetical protein